MKKYRFEIRKQIGFARTGKLTWGDKSITTPALLMPGHPNILKHFTLAQSKSQNLNEYYFEQLSSLIKDLPQYHIRDDLNIFNNPFLFNILSNSPNNSENLQNSKNSIFSGKIDSIQNNMFIQSNEFWGIPWDVNKPLQAQIESSEYIPILRESFPNSSRIKYEDYTLKANEMRLKLYEEKLFKLEQEIPAWQTQKYIIEVGFNQDPNYLKKIIIWINKNKEFLVGIKITGLFDNLMSFKEVLEWWNQLKLQTPSDLLWILGGKIYPENFALAIYLGFDLIDTAKILEAGMDGLYLTNESRHWLRELKYPLCSCPSCQILKSIIPFSKRISLKEAQLVMHHNVYSAQSEMQRIQQEISEGTIRTYLEKQIHVSPLSASMLRMLDIHYGDNVNSRFPLIMDHKVKCIGSESYHRPEIQNFIDRVKSEVTPAKPYKMVIILPCSARKPYSTSKSHKKFIRTIRRASGKSYKDIHQIIITSPTGLIPRELEKVFPAGHYDIPVTGYWDNDEIATTGDCLASWLQKYRISNKEQTEQLKQLEQNPLNSEYPIIIAHVTEGYRKSVEKTEEILKNLGISIPIHYTIPVDANYGPTSDPALKSLSETIENNINQTQKHQLAGANESESTEENKKRLKLQRLKKELKKITEDEIVIRATLDYQFGKGAGNLIIRQGAILIKSRFPEFDEAYVFDGMGKLNNGRRYNNSGLFRITPRGAELLLDHQKNKVIIKEAELPGTTVFRPILDTLDMNMHPGDDVFVVNDFGEYIGVGELVQGPQECMQSHSGKICKLRKKVKHSKKSSDKTNKKMKIKKKDLEKLSPNDSDDSENLDNLDNLEAMGL
ncbi:MAG: DUF5591 domain-containing protein [Promethearchaeota archaeon]